MEVHLHLISLSRFSEMMFGKNPMYMIKKIDLNKFS